MGRKKQTLPPEEPGWEYSDPEDQSRQRMPSLGVCGVCLLFRRLLLRLLDFFFLPRGFRRTLYAGLKFSERHRSLS